MRYSINKEENKRQVVAEYLRSLGIYDVRVRIDDDGEVELYSSRKKTCKPKTGAEVYEYLLNILPIGNDRLRREIIQFAKKFGIDAKPTYSRVRY